MATCKDLKVRKGELESIKDIYQSKIEEKKKRGKRGTGTLNLLTDSVTGLSVSVMEGLLEEVEHDLAEVASELESKGCD
jgi:hypothetical protein